MTRPTVSHAPIVSLLARVGRRRATTASVLAWSVLLVGAASAGEFAGLVPGIARKAEAERVLGPPIREVTPGIRYDYDSARHDAGRVSVEYERGTQVVRRIDLYFTTAYGKAQYQRWFGLQQPVRTERDSAGHLVEYYLPEGIVLTYQGADDRSPVAFFSHLDLRLINEPAARPPAPTGVAAPPARTEAPSSSVAPPAPRPSPVPPSTAAARPGLEPRAGTIPVPAAQATAPYLGAVIAGHEGIGARVEEVAAGSPAARAGLQPGDIVLELGSAGFYEANIESWRIALLVAALLPGQPIDLLVQRGSGRIRATVTPESRSLDAARRRQLAGAFNAASRWRLQGGDHTGAAADCEQAIRLEPGEAFHYHALAEVHRRGGDRASVIATLQRGVDATRSHRLYRELGFAYREAERYGEAIDALNEAIARAPPDQRDGELFNQLGYSYLRMRRESDALPALEEAHRIDPKSPTALYFLARCHDELGHRDPAIRFYRAFLDLGRTDDQWVQFARARLNALGSLPGHSDGRRPSGGFAF